MYGPALRQPDGLGGFADILANVILPVGGAIGGALATRLVMGPSTPSQKDLEAQMKLQTQLDIQRSMVQQQQTMEFAQYLVPAAAILGLVLILRG